VNHSCCGEGGAYSTLLTAGEFSNGNDGIVLKDAGKILADIKGQNVNLVELSKSTANQLGQIYLLIK